MSFHFNIQVSIQKVEKVETPGRGVTPPSVDRQTTDVLKLAVTAETEEQAFRKAVRILQANAPEPVQNDHLHRASCHGPVGELQCGFPPGPTI